MAAIAIFAGSALAGVASAPAISLAATPTMSLGGAATSVTANSLTWMLLVSWNQIVSGETPTLVVGLQRTDTTGGTGEEGHYWYFDVTTSTLTFSAKTGTGTLNAGTQASPAATVKLSFKSTSNKKGTCTSGSETIYSGTLSGAVSLALTGLTGGGTAGGTNLKFTMGTPQLTVDSACVPPVPSECAAALAFSSGNSAVTSPVAVGLSEKPSGKAIDFVGVERQTLFSSPKNAVRDDVADQEGAPAKYDSTTKVLSVTTSTSGLVTGSAKLSGGTPKTATTTCTVSKQKYKLRATSDQNAKYASPAGKSISAKTSLSGTLTAPASATTGIYDVITVKAV